MVVATLVAVLGLLVLVLELGAEHSARECADDAVAAHLVAAKVPRGTAAERTHQSTVTLSLRIRICGAVLLLVLSWLAVWVLPMRVLVLWIGALLGELVLRLGTGILTLLLAVLLLLVIGCYLAVLEASMCRRAILLVIALLLVAAIVALGSTLLLGRIAGGLPIAGLLIPLLRRILALVLGRILLVALVVLIVGAGHDEYVRL